jgi:hypothetical protein
VSNEKKLIWIIAVVLLPVLGLILWFFLGPRIARVDGREMPDALRFNVFGKIMVAERSIDGWQLFVLGGEGKRSSAGVVIPIFIQEDEVGQYLDDIFTRWQP